MQGVAILPNHSAYHFLSVGTPILFAEHGCAGNFVMRIHIYLRRVGLYLKVLELGKRDEISWADFCCPHVYARRTQTSVAYGIERLRWIFFLEIDSTKWA